MGNKNPTPAAEADPVTSKPNPAQRTPRAASKNMTEEVPAASLQSRVMTFDMKNFGKNVRFSSNWRTAERVTPRDQFCQATVFSKHTLADDQLFQIRLDQLVSKWGGSISFGVTSTRPSAFDLQGENIFKANTKIIIWEASEISDSINLKSCPYGKRNLEDVQNGDRLGVLLTAAGDLHFFLNGEDQGVAAKRVQKPLWAVVDIYGRAAKVSIVEDNSLLYKGKSGDHSGFKFHQICGKNVSISPGNRTAERISPNENYNNGLVLTHRTLRESELFQVRLDKTTGRWTGQLELGVTQVPPDRKGLPETLTDLRQKTWALSGNTLYACGQEQQDLDYHLDLDTLKVQDTVGLMLKKGNLHFYHNGTDMGVATTGLPGDLYGVIDLYGCAVQLSITPNKVKKARRGQNQLLFDSRCGMHATVYDEGTKAKRDHLQFNNGVVFTDRRLDPGEIFQVKIEDMVDTWSGSVEIGVAADKPAEIEEMTTMTYEDNAWMLSGCTMFDGKMTNRTIKYKADLDLLKIGDRVGVSVQKDRTLHFHINGVDKGVAASNVPHRVYGVVDVYGKTVQVSLYDPAEEEEERSTEETSANLETLEGITVDFREGRIVDEVVDVIVNTTNPELKLRAGGLSRALDEAAGSAVQQDCLRKYPGGIQLGEIAETVAGKLPCKAIYHGSLPPWDDGKGTAKVLKDFVWKLLSRAEDTGRTSIAIPAIGTGTLRYPPEVVARIIVDTITSFSKKHRHSQLRDIRIVLYPDDKATIKGFEVFMSSAPNVQEIEEPIKVPHKKQTLELPDFWKPMSGDQQCVSVTLSTKSDEYIRVANSFVRTGGPNTVVRVERIQSRNAYFLYHINRDNVDSTIRDKKRFPAERTLYHGTSGHAVPSINKNGFNRAYCGKNAVKFGQGVYFAMEANYSSQKIYSPPDDTRQRYVYQCKVLTGEFTTGTADMKVPPAKDPNADANDLYHTVVDDEQDPRIFVAFHDASAYPEYLIVFQ